MTYCLHADNDTSNPRAARVTNQAHPLERWERKWNLWNSHVGDSTADIEFLARHGNKYLRHGILLHALLPLYKPSANSWHMKQGSNIISKLTSPRFQQMNSFSFKFSNKNLRTSFPSSECGKNPAHQHTRCVSSVSWCWRSIQGRTRFGTTIWLYNAV